MVSDAEVWDQKTYDGLRLNPCCSGRWSLTAEKAKVPLLSHVLILVVVEDGL